MTEIPTLTVITTTLNMEALDAASTWEAALSLPLPENPTSELLERARLQVLQYLDFYLNDCAPRAPDDELRAEIMRAAERLIEIGIAAGPAQRRAIDEGLARDRAAREKEWRANHPQIVKDFQDLDKTGIGFRYSKNKDGLTIKLPDAPIDLENVKNVMEAVDNYFSGVDGYLGDMDYSFYAV